jgi:hypothetical protein
VIEHGGRVLAATVGTQAHMLTAPTDVFDDSQDDVAAFVTKHERLEIFRRENVIYVGAWLKRSLPAQAVAPNATMARAFFEIMSAQAARAIPEGKEPGMLQMMLLYPDSKPSMQRFAIGAIDGRNGMLNTAMAAAESGQNCYIEGRTVRVGAKGRGKEGDTEWIFAFVVDSDADKGTAVDEADLPLPPSMIVESSSDTSGNHHFWYFLDSAVRAEAGKKLGEAIRRSVKADSDTGTITQPYKVAGTVAYPNKTKKDRGRTSNSNTYLVEHSGALYTPEQILAAFKAPEAKAEKPHAGAGAQEEPSRAYSSEPIDEAGVSPDILEIIKNGVEKGKRSDAFHHVVRDLKEDGYAVEPIHELLARYPDGIAATYPGRLFGEVSRSWVKISLTYNDTGGEAPATPSQLKALRKQAKIDRRAALEYMNVRYMVTRDGSKTWVLLDTVDPDFDGRQVYHYMKMTDLALLYANRNIVTRIDDEGKKTKKPIVGFWNTHPERRQYIGGIVFDPSPDYVTRPDVLNLWRGFAVKPAAGKWDLMRAHLFDNVCCGDGEHFEYLMGWLATMYQRPNKPAEVAVVLQGKKGTGKGVFGNALCRLFGRHGLSIASSKHLTGNFNAHLRDCVFLLSDEAFYAGDKAGEGVLKALITEPTITIEGKFKDAISCPNRLHVMMLSNSKWIVPAGLEERRFFVLNVSEERMQDHKYFAAIDAELKAGGYEAMLHDLLHYGLSGFNVRSVPETEALQDQKTQSLATELAWLDAVAHRGYVYKSRLGLEDYFEEWETSVSTALLFASYTEFAKERKEWRLMSDGTFGKFLTNEVGVAPGRLYNRATGERLCNDKSSSDRAEPIIGKQPSGYYLGTLEEFRARFVVITGLERDWPPCTDDESAKDHKAPWH